MQISIELSLYPLAQDNFKEEIWSFIKRLRQVPELKVVTNGMSTQVFGEYDLATSHVLSEIKQVHQKLGAAVFVCKFIAGDRSVVEPSTSE
jgi:uncharacterized protein YqgV (UPF0045/DUF77 family)